VYLHDTQKARTKTSNQKKSVFTKEEQSRAEQLNVTRKPVHPAPDLFWEVNGGGNAILDTHPYNPRDTIIGMRHDLLFRGPGHTIAGDETKKCAFIGSHAGTNMALHDPGNLFRVMECPEYIRTHLPVIDPMRLPAPDIMKQRTTKDERTIDHFVTVSVL